MATRPEMDVAANKALTELAKQDIRKMTALNLVAWLARWYMRAGYTRLCRGLLRLPLE